MVFAKGLRISHLVTRMMGRHQYSNMLESTMLPQAIELLPDGNYVFMYDKPTCCTARSVSELLHTNSIGIRPRSFDREPSVSIENHCVLLFFSCFAPTTMRIANTTTRNIPGYT